MKKCDKVIKIIDSWRKTLDDNPLLFTDHYNNNNQTIGFIENRHDQSIFSVISKLNSPLLLADETYFKKFSDRKCLKYPFWATRKKK